MESGASTAAFAAVHESGNGTELPISNVRCYGEFRGQSGLIVLILSFGESDPFLKSQGRTNTT
jgi:hypothetical protein